jgi:hypothetical protein
MNNMNIVERVRERLAAKGIIKGNEIGTQGYLRLGANVNTTLNTINFDVLQTNGNTAQITTEKRLNVTDMFTVTHWALYLVKAGGLAGEGGTAATAADIATARNFTYPNPYVFATAANGNPTFVQNQAAGQLVPYTRESQNLYSIYNGNISVVVDRETIIDSYDCLRFLRVPTEQQQQATAAAAIAPAAAVIGMTAGHTFDAWLSDSYGFSEVDPQFTLNGIGDTSIQIKLPTAVNLAGVSSTNFVFLQMRGIRWQNASKLNA